MILLSVALRKIVLMAHVATSVALMGAVAAFFALAMVGLFSTDSTVVRAAYVAMNLIAEAVIVPLALAAVLIGILSSVGTAWGLFQHYWVVVKLGLTLFTVVVLLIQMPRVGVMANLAGSMNLAAADYRSDRFALVLHAGGGLLVLLVILGLSLYKPQGMTRLGQRKRFQQ